MGANATTIGQGDVSGIIKRSSIASNTSYSMGNQYTTIFFSNIGTLPTEMSLKVSMGSAPSWRAGAIERVYDFIQTGGSGTEAVLQSHYLDSELNGNDENKLAQWLHTYAVPLSIEYGSSDYNTNENWVSVSQVNVGDFSSVFGAKEIGLDESEYFAPLPDLGSASDFILFTTNGGLGNTGVSEIYGGAIGTNFGAIVGFGNVNCVQHIQDAVTAQCSLDLQAAFDEIHIIPITQTITAAALSGGTFTAGVYYINTAVNLTVDLTLDAQNHPERLFIFNVTGAFNAAAAIKIILLNGALAQNIYWNVDAAVGFGAGASMKGTFLSLRSNYYWS